MSATPGTTQLGPDQARVRDVLRRLAEVESTDAPVISAYVDLRPQSHADRPGERPQIGDVRRRLDAVGRGVGAHPPAATSLSADRDRIIQAIEGDDLDGVAGMAIFACDAIGLWEVVASHAEFDTEIHAGPTAELFQLARLLDDSESALVVVVNTSTCRVFVTRRGALRQSEAISEPDEEHKRHEQGGWSQARFQRHIDMQDKRFAKEAAEAIERVVQREKPRTIVLAGDERVIPILEAELPEHVQARVSLETHIHVHANRDEVEAQVRPLLAAIESAEDEELADRAIGAVKAGALGVAGVDDTMAALEMGQVDELVIDEAAKLDPDLRAELIRQAALTDSKVTIVREHEGLARYEGVAATLRFRI